MGDSIEEVEEFEEVEDLEELEELEGIEVEKRQGGHEKSKNEL
jgi:hypothetical protein